MFVQQLMSEGDGQKDGNDNAFNCIPVMVKTGGSKGRWEIKMNEHTQITIDVRNTPNGEQNPRKRFRLFTKILESFTTDSGCLMTDTGILNCDCEANSLNSLSIISFEICASSTSMIIMK